MFVFTFNYGVFSFFSFHDAERSHRVRVFCHTTSTCEYLLLFGRDDVQLTFYGYFVIYYKLYNVVISKNILLEYMMIIIN